MKKYRVRFDGIAYYSEVWIRLWFWIGSWERVYDNRGLWLHTTEKLAWRAVEDHKEPVIPTKFIRYEKDRKEIEG